MSTREKKKDYEKFKSLRLNEIKKYTDDEIIKGYNSSGTCGNWLKYITNEQKEDFLSALYTERPSLEGKIIVVRKIEHVIPGHYEDLEILDILMYGDNINYNNLILLSRIYSDAKGISGSNRNMIREFLNDKSLFYYLKTTRINKNIIPEFHGKKFFWKISSDDKTNGIIDVMGLKPLVVQLQIPGGNYERVLCSNNVYSYIKNPLGEYFFNEKTKTFDIAPIRHMYTSFESVDEYYNWTHNHVSYLEERCFFETMLNYSTRYMYYDLDIKLDKLTNKNLDDFRELAELVKDKVISNSILLIYYLFGIMTDINQDVIITTSHKEGVKYSYHIKFNNCKLKNYKDCKEFYNQAIISGSIDYIPNRQNDHNYYNKGQLCPFSPEELSMIDHSVYSSTQQMRTIGSTKIYNNRPIIFADTFKFWDIDVIRPNFEPPPSRISKNIWEDIQRYRLSFITVPLSYQIGHKGFILCKDNSIQNKNYSKQDIGDLDPDDVINKFKTTYPEYINVFDLNGYYYNENKNKIFLKRLLPHKCIVCHKHVSNCNKEVHTSQNLYINISTASQKLYIKCFNFRKNRR